MIFLFASEMKEKLIELQDGNLNRNLDENLNQNIDENLNENLNKNWKENLNESHDVCCICYDDLLLDEALTKPLCGNYFHFDCLTQWMMKSTEEVPTCPICRVQKLRLFEIRRYVPERNTFRNVSALEKREYILQKNQLNDKLNEAERRRDEVELRRAIIKKIIGQFFMLTSIFMYIMGGFNSLCALTKMNSTMFVHNTLLTIISIIEFVQSTGLFIYVLAAVLEPLTNILTLRKVCMNLFSWIISIVYFVLLRTYFSSNYKNGEYN